MLGIVKFFLFFIVFAILAILLVIFLLGGTLVNLFFRLMTITSPAQTPNRRKPSSRGHSPENKKNASVADGVVDAKICAVCGAYATHACGRQDCPLNS